MDVFHHGLKGVETTGFGDFDFGAEILDEIFENDAIGAGEKGEDGFDKVAFVVVEFRIPVGLVAGEIDFFGGPERILVVFVGLPDGGVLDREETVTLGLGMGRCRDRGHFMWFSEFNFFLGFVLFICLDFFRSGAKIFKTKKNKRKKIKIFIFVCHPFHPFHPTSTTKKIVVKPTVSYHGFVNGLKKINPAL